MPKIIEHLEEKLMAEARRQIEEAGYSAMTIRSVAKGCDVGVGTVYNYFPSKDELLAAYLLRDWKECVAAIHEASCQSATPEPALRCMFDQLLAFSTRHRAIFRDEAAASAFAGSFSRYHGLLRSQLAAPLRKFCSGDFPAEFIAESLLTWSLSGKTFDQIYAMIEGLFHVNLP